MSTQRKPLTLDDARSRAETMVRIDETSLKARPDSLDAGQEHSNSQMLRRLLEASAAGPTTHNSPTGAGDFDIVCDGCGEIVAEPHTWAECCAAQRERVAKLRDAMVEQEAQRAAVLENLHDALDIDAMVSKCEFDRVLYAEDQQAVENASRDLIQSVLESVAGPWADLQEALKERTAERDTARKHGDDLEDALLAIKEAIDAPHDMTALDAVKALATSKSEVESQLRRSLDQTARSLRYTEQALALVETLKATLEQAIHDVATLSVIKRSLERADAVLTNAGDPRDDGRRVAALEALADEVREAIESAKVAAAVVGGASEEG